MGKQYDWEKVPIENICKKIQYGLTSKSGCEYKGPKYLRITDIQEGSVEWDSVPRSSVTSGLEKYFLKPGDIVFARTGATVGKSFLIKTLPEKAVFASYLIRIISDQEKVVPEFLWYYFQSPMYWSVISEKQRGIGQPNVNGKILGAIRVPMPESIEMQSKMVEELDAQFTRLDSAVKTLKKLKDKLKSYRQSILKAAFENRLLESNDKWEKGAILDYCKKVKQLNLKSENFNHFTYIDISSVDNDRQKIVDPKILASDEAPSRAKQETLPGDIVYSTVRVYLKNLAIVPEVETSKIVSSTGFTVLRPDERLNNKFLFYYLLREDVTRKLNSMQRGTSYPAIRDNDLFNFEINLPCSVELQEAIVHEIESRFSVIDKIEETMEETLKKTELFKNSILKIAFEGKLVKKGVKA